MYTSAGVSLSHSDVDECIGLVTYLTTSYDLLDAKCILPCTRPVLFVLSTLYVAVQQFTSCPTHWSQLSTNSMPDRGRRRALVNAVMKPGSIKCGEFDQLRAG